MPQNDGGSSRTAPSIRAPRHSGSRARARLSHDELAERFARLCSASHDARGALSAVLVVAHPDDEAVGAGALLGRLDDVTVVYATDGAPRDLRDARAAGFETRDAYAAARCAERDAALAVAGIAPERIRELGAADQEATHEIAWLAKKIAEIIADASPDVVITHPYEGGHPDHDATAAAVHAALALLRREGARCPLLLEQTSYFNRAGALATYDFIPDGARAPITLTLSPAECAMKEAMFARYATQQRVLAQFPIGVERFRIAPTYDFTRRPHDGVLWYELFPWGMTGERFVHLAGEALERLGLRAASSRRADRLRVEEATTCGALAALSEEWHALMERCPWATPFQSPEWLLAWWRALGGGELCVATLRSGDRLVGLAPLFIYTEADGRRCLAMLGAGLSDYEDVLLEPEHARDGTALVLRYIADRASRWDEATFHEVRAASPLHTAAWPDALTVERETSSSCAVLPLPHSTDALPACLSRRMHRRLNLARNRIARMGDARFVLADAESLPTLLDDVFRLHGLRWTDRGEAGVLADPRLRPFHQSVAAGFLQRGWLRLHALLLDDRSIAVIYAFAHRNRAYSYITGFDPDAAYCSPGVLLLHRAVEQAIHDGARELDMLRGEESYKYDWGPERRENARLRVRRHGR